ncbi:MAG: preprotein translocase subunit SecE [Pseudomonadales bacterium]|jgi:preprotein translocase subunit SecE|nr:preprotein translocase subunit SecE [Pseudomonadales bacterium]
MNDKAKEVGSSFDSIKWVLVVALVTAGVYGNSHFAAESLLYRVGALLVLAVLAGVIVAQTAKGKAFIDLGRDARTEIRKVVWPTRQETVHTTLIVVVVVILVAILLWGLDSSVSWLISLLIGS